MATGSVLAFWAVAFLLIVVPGPDWAFTIGAGLAGRSVVPAVSGLVVGYAAVTAIVAAGVGALVAGSPSALTALTLIGGAYLIWQGATTLTHPATASTGPDAGTGWHTFLRGIGVSGLN
ncbi:LysE family transporter, partial [Micromonospora aurantiaca]|nr:LysE family transporter [Micromonospora aurantiaca]